MGRPRKREVEDTIDSGKPRKVRPSTRATASAEHELPTTRETTRKRGRPRGATVKVEHDPVESEDLQRKKRKRTTASKSVEAGSTPHHAGSPSVSEETTLPGTAQTRTNGKARASRKTKTQDIAFQVSKGTPSLVKQESESALAALSRIAAVVHTPQSDSDSSEDNTESARDNLGNGQALGKKKSAIKNQTQHGSSSIKAEEDDDDDDDLFEDVDISAQARASSKFDVDDTEEPTEDLNLTLEKAERIQLAKTGKKKQSVRAVHERAFCHYMSTIAMVALGAWRNMWIGEPKLQRMLRKLMNIRNPLLNKELTNLAQNKQSTSHDFVEIIGRFMKVFSGQFKRTRPGLRKLGHRHVAQMDAGNYVEEASETFKDVEDYIEQAQSLQGSRDFGAQLFTAILRSYHFRARLVFSTQPLGFKFNEREEFSPALVQSIKEDNERRAAGPEDTKRNKESAGKPKKSMGTKHNAISIEESDLSDLDSQYSIDPDLLSDVDDLNQTTKTLLPRKVRRVDDDLEYPIFWTELYDFTRDRWLAIDAMVKEVVLVEPKDFKSLHPRGVKAEQQKLTLGFVVAYDANRHAKDVTMRYASSWAKVKEVFLRADGKLNTRYDVNKILVGLGNPFRDEMERQEDDLLAFKEAPKPMPDEMPKTLADFKASPKYVLDKHLREKESFKPGARNVSTFTIGKGAKEIVAKVHLRSDVIAGKTIENYHKEGRKIRKGEQPIKMIKARAMTTNRIREHQQQVAETGEEHVMQGIYSIDQTEYIIPPPIKNGIIPKNAYGNADVFVESMIPQGATHLKLKGASRIARKLEIEHAEAVVGFEFKKRGAIPVVLGVLVADENAERLEAAWHEAEEIRIRKEDKKRSDAALKLWAKLLKGMRIRRRINAEYGIPEQDEVQDNGAMYEDENKEAIPALPGIKMHDCDDDEEVLADGGFVRDDS